MKLGGSPRLAGITASPSWRLMGIEVDDADHGVAAGLLGVGDQRVVGGVEEGDVGELLQRRVLAAGVVEAGDHRQQRSVERALLDLVLLGVQVLLRARPDGDVLEVLVAGVDPVARAERRRQHEPRLERRPAAVLEVLVQDVGRVGEEVGPEVLLLAGVGQLGDVLGQLPARVLPGEVGVGLAEADLAQMAHHRALGERLGEEDHVAVAGVDLVDQPRPERERLGVRVVDAEHLHAAVDPVQHHRQQRVPQRAPVRRLPVDVVDVLVALGRVLGVLERAVGAAVKPLGVLGQPRVVGRALDREVERDVDAVAGRGSGQRAQVVDRAELGVDRVVAAGGVADRPRRAGVGRAPRSARCRGPCGWCSPIGWIGGR